MDGGKSSMANQVWAHPEVPLGKDGKTLLVQMGGEEKVTQWVYGFYDSMLEDKKCAPFLKKSQATQSLDVYMKLLKDRTAEYLETVWGGDTWEGQDMFCAHSYLHISPDVFDRAIILGKNYGKKMGLSAAVVDQIVAEMMVMREPMTDPDGKFIAWYKKREKEIEAQCLAEGAVDPSGMGFTTSPAMVKQMQDKIAADAERKRRLAEAKKQREQEEKRIKKEKQKAAQEAKQKGTQEPTSAKTPKGKEDSAADGKAKDAAKNGAAPKAKAKAKANKDKEKELAQILPELPNDGDQEAFMPSTTVTPRFRDHFCKAAGATPTGSSPTLSVEQARQLLTKAIAKAREPENKETLLGILKECEAAAEADPDQASMIKMMKLLPAVQTVMTPVLEAFGFGPNDLMAVVMQIQMLAPQDPTIAENVAKFMKAAQGDLGDLLETAPALD